MLFKNCPANCSHGRLYRTPLVCIVHSRVVGLERRHVAIVCIIFQGMRQILPYTRMRDESCKEGRERQNYPTCLVLFMAIYVVIRT